MKTYRIFYRQGPILRETDVTGEDMLVALARFKATVPLANEIMKAEYYKEVGTQLPQEKSP